MKRKKGNINMKKNINTNINMKKTKTMNIKRNHPKENMILTMIRDRKVIKDIQTILITMILAMIVHVINIMLIKLITNNQS